MVTLAVERLFGVKAQRGAGVTISPLEDIKEMVRQTSGIESSRTLKAQRLSFLEFGKLRGRVGGSGDLCFVGQSGVRGVPGYIRPSLCSQQVKWSASGSWPRWHNVPWLAQGGANLSPSRSRATS